MRKNGWKTWIAPSPSILLLLQRRWREFRAVTLGTVVCFYVGYALYVAFNGPPFVNVYRFDEKIDIELSRDCVLQMVHYFFRKTQEEGLYFYQPKPVNEEIHELLVEGGFDPFEDNPTLDPDETCYVLWRHTYVAYYGEEAGGREGEFDTYAEEGEGADDDGGSGAEEE